MLLNIPSASSSIIGHTCEEVFPVFFQDCVHSCLEDVFRMSETILKGNYIDSKARAVCYEVLYLCFREGETVSKYKIVFNGNVASHSTTTAFMPFEAASATNSFIAGIVITCV